MNETELKPLCINRRQALSLLGVLGTGSFIGCNGSLDSSTSDSTSSSDTSSSTTTTTTTTESGSCTLIPEETEGPYPLSAVLSNSAMVRQDITEGKTGVPLTLVFKLVDINNGCEPITTSASVYVWHCDKDGVYSGYSQPGANTVGETFMRGIQDVDDAGQVTFSTIYPGWYAGRITHIHFQVFLYSSSVATATSQLAFPQDTTTEVYNSTLYTKGQNTSVTSFGSDNVFSDGTTYQMASISGNVSEGYTATLEIGIAAS